MTVRRPKPKHIIYLILGFFALTGATWVISTLLDLGKDVVIDASHQEKYIAVVMSKSDETFTIPTEFLTGFGSSNHLKTKGGEVVKISYRDDHYSVEEAERVAMELVNDENCVMIIGNSNSELTTVTLGEIVRSSSRPAFILPIATATQLTAIAQSAGYNAMLRMIPDNEDQATQIKSFIAKRTTNQRVAILVDEENRAYSEDLAKKISAKIRKNGGQIIYKKNYGDASRLVDDFERLRDHAQSPEILIFVGVSNNGLLLIDELATFDITVPVVFTDGCTVEELIERSATLRNESYFLSAVTISEGQKKATYEPIGADAYKLAEIIISGVNGNSRRSIGEHVQADKKDIIIHGGAAGNYEFGPDGNNTAMRFHVYTQEEGRLKEVSGY